MRWATALALALRVVTPAAAWITLAEGDKGKLEIETRFEFWGVVSGRETLSGQNERIDDFLIRRARVVLRGQLSPKLEVGVHFGQDNVNARIPDAESKVRTEDAGFKIKDAYLNYKAAEGLQVMAGQFKIPFLRSNLESSFNQVLVDRPALPSVRPAREGTRDVGGMVWGNRGGFQYRAALFDGSDQEDKNPGGTFRGTARASYNWFSPEPGAAFTGTTLGQKRILQIGGQADAQNDRLDPKDLTPSDLSLEPRDYRAWAADVFYDQPFKGGWAFTFEGAYLERRDDYEDPLLPTRSIEGAYAQAAFLLPVRVGKGRLQLAGRYEDLDTDTGGSTATVRSRTAGLNYYGRGHDRKIQVDYTQRRERPAEKDDDELRLSVIAVF